MSPAPARPAPRILAGAILHETNTFNRVATRLSAFAGRYLCLDADDIVARLSGTATEMGGFIDAAKRRRWTLLPRVAAACGPSGPLRAEDWARLRRRMLDDPAPCDGVLLALHGAMVTEDSADPEGELVAALRQRLGPAVPIVVTVDMHANLGLRMVEAADAVFPYETYPHVDHAECAERAAAALDHLLGLPAGTGRLTRGALARPPMLDAADHGRTAPGTPMSHLLDVVRTLRARPGVVNASLTVGFPWADIADAGPAALVTVVRDSDIDTGSLARDLATRLWRSRAQTQTRFPGVDEAMAAARNGPVDGVHGKPLVLADFADNPAGGAYGDSPNLLRAMLDAGLEQAVFASLADPAAVDAARRAGPGARLSLALGGHHDPGRTPPLRVQTRVEALHDGRFQLDGPMLRGTTCDMGAMALLRINGVQVIVASRALAVTDPALFRVFGIDPAGMHTIALKSRNHHRAAFEPMARAVMLVDAGGIASMQLHSIGYRHVRRPLWPLDPMPDHALIRLHPVHSTEPPADDRR